MQADNDLLRDIPDFAPDFGGLESWVEERLTALRAEAFGEAAHNSFAGISAPADPATRRRFVAGALLADWACYQRKPDRVDLPRLCQVVDLFPQGFRLWLCRLGDGRFTPVGYTGWYPIAPEVTTVLETRPETIPHRGFMQPLSALSEEGNHIYLFNYSIAEPLRKSASSRALIKGLAADIATARPLALSAVAVSEDGIRIARRFGLDVTGAMNFMGEEESVLTGRTIPRPRQTPGLI